MRTLNLLVLLGLLIASSTSSRAELPPSAYESWQEKAPESLVIKVRSVHTAFFGDAVTIKAQIEQVRRSQSGLKSGEVIRITYEHRKHGAGWVGPSEVPILEEGQLYPAYLRKGGGQGYEPAAGGYSFRELK